MKRRDFFKKGAGSAAAFAFFSKSGLSFTQDKDVDLAVAKNSEPGTLVKAAVNELGGMKKFISTGDVVAVKPNMSWDRVPEQAANTNPEAVKTVVQLCFEAGAKRGTRW